MYFIQVYLSLFLESVSHILIQLFLLVKIFGKIFQKKLMTTTQKLSLKELGKMSNWVDTSFISKSIDTCLVFYPFSGPDFLHANFLYPNANEYILMALEDVGSMPDWKSLGAKKNRKIFRKCK